MQKPDWMTQQERELAEERMREWEEEQENPLIRYSDRELRNELKRRKAKPKVKGFRSN